MPTWRSASGPRDARADAVAAAASTGPIPQASVSAPPAPSSSRCVAATTRITRRTLPPGRGSLERVNLEALARIATERHPQWYIARKQDAIRLHMPRSPDGEPSRAARKSGPRRQEVRHVRNDDDPDRGSARGRSPSCRLGLDGLRIVCIDVRPVAAVSLGGSLCRARRLGVLTLEGDRPAADVARRAARLPVVRAASRTLPRARYPRGEELGERARRRDALARARNAEAERLTRKARKNGVRHRRVDGRDRRFPSDPRLAVEVAHEDLLRGPRCQRLRREGRVRTAQRVRER